MSWEDTECKACGYENAVFPVGSGKIMLLGSEPGRDEISQGVPHVGAVGEILRSELAYHGLDMYGCRLANLWLHPPMKPKSRKKDDIKAANTQNNLCLEHSVRKVLKQTKKCEAILLLGAKSVKYFTGQNVSDVSGLQVQSDILSVPLIMASVQASSAFHGGVGEFRLAISKFVKALENANLL
jgi:uracil-DNA glycosylase family 4